MKNVSVNGELLSLVELRARTAHIRLEREATAGPLSLEARLLLQDEALRLLIDRTLIIQEARRLLFLASNEEVGATLLKLAKRFDDVAGCRAGADTTESREDIQKRILVDKVLDYWRNMARRPKLSEQRDYYRKNKQQFYLPETVHAAHIVCHVEAAAADEDAARQKAEALRARVIGGEAFGHIASEYSDCPENQGDLGWFARGLMVQEFDDVIFQAPIGELTPVFRTQFGYHFAVVHARKAAGVRSFDDVRLEIESALWLARQDEEVGRALAALQAKAVVRRGA